MVLQFIFLTALLLCSQTTEAGEIFLLFNNWNGKCLHDDINYYARGYDCDPSNLKQQWRWIDGLYLQNVGSAKCITSLPADPYFDMQNCVPGSNDQRLICSFNMITGSHLGQNRKRLGMKGGPEKFQMSGNSAPKKERWSVYGAVNKKSICNGKTIRDGRKWWRLENDVEDVSSGLSPWITFTRSSSKAVEMMDGTGKKQDLYGNLDIVNTAPHAVWGIRHSTMYFVAQNALRHDSTPWQPFLGGYNFLDFTMPGTGWIITTDRKLCCRLGIKENLVSGNGWKCEGSSVSGVEDFSCGVTGCFGLFAGILHFRQGITPDLPIGTEWTSVGNPKHETFVKIKAGPIYELWGITVDGYPYRRLGMTDSIPMGTAWELVPDVLLKDVSFGIYGPVGIAKDLHQMIILNGSPTPKRQQEMDDFCTLDVPQCTSGTVDCPTKLTSCRARFTPKISQANSQWRCHIESALSLDGNLWEDGAICLFTRHRDLQDIALRYPVLGDFEKQLWLDASCQSSAGSSGCSQPYFSYYNTTSDRMLCRSVVTDSSCPVITDKHEELLTMTRGSCADNPLIASFAGSQFSTSVKVTNVHDVKLSGSGLFCYRYPYGGTFDVFVEIDFLFRHKICAVGILGFDGFYIPSYRISYGVVKNSWNHSSLFGHPHVYEGNVDVTTLVKRYLSAEVEARWFRITFPTVKAEKRCLRFEVYGSSLETEADSCNYYKDHLNADLDGIYNIYPKDTEIKKRVFCKGITDQKPVVENPFEELVGIEEIGCFRDTSSRAMSVRFHVSATNVVAECQTQAHAAGYEVFGIQVAVCFSGPRAHLTYNQYGEAGNCVDGKGGDWSNTVYRIRKAEKFFWPLNTSADGTPAPIKHGEHAVNVFQASTSRALARFPNYCFTNLERCNDGLSLEFWLWYNYTLDYMLTRVIRSGIGQSISSRGFTVYLRYQHICMEIHFEWHLYKACVGPLGKPKYWLHVLAFWDASSALTLIVDDLNLRSQGIRKARHHRLFDYNSVLRLGDNYHGLQNKYEIAIHSLTIWARKLSEDEVEARFTKGYTVAEEGETCDAACVAKGLTCDPAMSGNFNNILSRLGVKCASNQSYNSLDQAQPYVTADKTCHGLFEGEKNISCSAVKDAVRRLCRCERPVHGEFTEWSHWSFCSRTCGSGRRVRTRSCTHPSPRFGGNDCEGKKIMHDDCEELPCDVQHGILHEIWLSNPNRNFVKAHHIYSIKTYPDKTSFSHIIEDFAMETNRSFYGERFRTYFIAPKDGDYKFTMECPFACSMTLRKRYKVPLSVFDITYGPKVMSSTVTDLVAGAKYLVEVISVHKDFSNQFKLGFECVASGLNINPITKEYLMWPAQAEQGISREMWDVSRKGNVKISLTNTKNVVENEGEADFSEVIDHFDTGSFGKFYVQRLQSYFLARSNGQYRFYLSCYEICYLYMNDNYEVLSYRAEIASKWNSGSGLTKTLEGGKFYKIVVLFYQLTSDSEFVALGVTFPDGTVLHPIEKKYLWLKIPGKLEIERPAKQKSPQSPVGNAIDGLPNTCSTTASTTDPWLQLESQLSFSVYSVAITNQIANPSPLGNIMVKVGAYKAENGNHRNNLCYGPIASIPSGETIAYPCTSRPNGRFLIIWSLGDNRVLTACEIVVYGMRIGHVSQHNYDQGAEDGRVEQWQASSTEAMPRHDKRNIALYHPYSSWCAREDTSAKYWVVQFIEQRAIVGVMTNPDPLENKYVTKARIEVMDENQNWIVGRSSGNYDHFNMKQTPMFLKFKKTYITNSLKFIPLLWFHKPCVRLSIIGKQFERSFAWAFYFNFENTTRMRLSGAESFVKVGGERGYLIPRTSHIELTGLNILCLWDPKKCFGQFTIGMKLSLKDVAAGGVIFSTSGHNTSVVGTSLFLKDSNLVASIRTASRTWTVSAPASSLVRDSFTYIWISWHYNENIMLGIDEISYTAPYNVVPRLPYNGDRFTSVIKLGGINFILKRFNLDITPYTSWLNKRIQNSVDGWHTEWASWGYCSKSCGISGVQYRYRRCMNPYPKFDGLECPEATLKETRPCPKPSCETNDGILREVWMNKSSTQFSLTNVFDGYPSHLEVVANFSLTYNDGPFAERLRTFLQVNESGEFQFRMSCTYQCELWISPNDVPDEKMKILSHDASSNSHWPVSTLTGSYDFKASEYYFIEVRSLEKTGGRKHTLLKILGTGFSLVRHKPDRYHGLGAESGAIPDGRLFSGSSPSSSPFAYHGRLNNVFPHCAKKLNDRAFFVDLVELHWIVAVAVQGYVAGGLRGRVAYLQLKTRLDLEESGITTFDNKPTSYNANENPWTVKVINLTQPMRSRYVVIWMTYFHGDGCFRVDVIGCHAGNVAYQKRTEQSNSLNSNKAVDGSFIRWWKYCSTPSKRNDMIWWVVDFGRPYYIGEILIVGRRDCCQDRMQNLQVRIGHRPGASSLLNPQCGGLHSLWKPFLVSSLSVYCQPYSYGQYLTIARKSADDVPDISLCEVAAFQIENDTIFSNWSECSVTCGYGFQQRYSICIKPYYCKKEVEVRPCFPGQLCEILMQNCGQLHALGQTRSGTYKVRPNPSLENDIYIYCDHDTDNGGWLLLQRRYSGGALNMTQSWDMYRDGFGNVSTEFWIGNKYLSELTNQTAYEIMFLFKSKNGSVLKKTKCDAFNVSSEEENYRLQLGTCEGPDAEILKNSNWTEFSTWDKDNGLGLLNCASGEMTGWWFGSCDSYINDQNLSCFGQVSCNYDVTMMIKPKKVDGGWTHWSMWETCDKPCGRGNSSRVRSCTHPPPTGGGDDCEGAWNETRGCNTHSCPEIELNMTMRFTEETWTEDLLVNGSSTFTQLVNKIRNNILSLYENDPAITVLVHGFRQGSVIADVTIIYEALDGQQLIVLQEDLDQDRLLNQNMPVVYNHGEIVVTEVLFGPPVITESGNLSSSSIYIKWQPPNSTELYKIRGYRIFYKESNDTSLIMSVLSVEKDVSEIEINDLKLYTNYSVRVSAFSSSGNGVPTTSNHVMTDEDVPLVGPVIISAYNISCTSLNISWLAVDLPLFRGVPTGYVLHYRLKTADNTTAFLNATIDDYHATNINISDLMIYKVYEIYMTATTIKGQGIPGNYVYLRTDEDVPSVGPQNLTLEKNTSTSLNISWSAIHRDNVNGVLRGYVIEYWPIEDVNDTNNATVGPENTEVELINLLKFTNYSIRFAGMTYKGVGNWSDIMLQTAEDIPDWGPLHLTALNISETAINISWGLIPKEYRNGIIIGYRVHYKDPHRHSGNVTVPASQRNIILKNLLSYTSYNISVAGLTKAGEGWNKSSVLTMTNPGAPSREPWELVCSGQTSYTISLHWYRFTPGLTGSLLTGYLISYKAIKPPDPTIHNITVAGFKYNFIVEGLKGYTNYSFEMYVYNPWGRSKTSKVDCRTEEGKPLASPGNLIAVSKVAPDKIYLKWDVVPNFLMAGICRGYTISYKKTRKVGELVDDKEKRIDIFDPQKTECFVTGLETYSQYSFSVRVFNTKFFGDNSENIYADTCNCLQDFYMNWCSYMPYVNNSDSGIFPPLIRSAIYDICGNCSEFGQPKLYFETDLTGSSAKKSGLVHVKQSITDQNQINFPIVGRKDSKTFVSMVDSPGSVFVTLKPSLTMTVEYMFIETVIGTFPLLGFAVITASLAGMIMWCLESRKNTKDFPRSYNRGSSEGFWWAFISMTTVGYGDRAPVTIPGRIFAIIWTLYGLVITGILVGNLTSALTASVAFTVHEVDLYQAKIAAIENTSEFKLGLAKGAIVNKGRNYSDILTVLHAVEVGGVQGALLDMYVVASRPELITKDSPFMIKTVIQNPSTYGVELAGHASKLRKPFLGYLHNNAALVSRILEEQTNPVKESEVEIDLSGQPEGSDINVLAADSPMIKQPLLYSSIALCIALVFGLLFHFALCKRRRKALNHVDESVKIK